MNLSPVLVAALLSLGITQDELILLRGRMLSTVTSLGATLNALNGQIDTLITQRDAIAVEFAKASATVAKLVTPDP